MKARTIIGTVACAAALAIGGCGGDDEPATDTDTTEEIGGVSGISGASGASGTADAPSERLIAVLSARIIELSPEAVTPAQAACGAKEFAPFTSEDEIPRLQSDDEFFRDLVREAGDAADHCE